MSLEAKSFSNLITFTRASNATYFDSTGVLKRASSNVPRIDYNPLTLALRGMMIEEQRTNLFLYSESVDIAHGSWSKGTNTTRVGTEYVLGKPATIYRGDGSGANEFVRQTISVTSGTTYVVSVYARLVSGTNPTSGHLITIETTPGSSSPRTALSYSSISLSSTVARYSIAFTATGTGTTSIYLVADQNNTAEISLMGAQVEVGAFPTSYIPSSVTFSGRTSIGTYYDSTGLLRKASSGVSRLNYNPTNLNYDPFLLLEESRTNLLTYSEYFNNAAWVNTNTSIISNIIVAPDGTLNGDKLVEDTISGNHEIVQAFTPSASTTYTFSCYMKAAELTSASLRFTAGFGAAVGVTFTLTDNGSTATLQGSPSNPTITHVGNGWYRCSFTATSGASPSSTNSCVVTRLGAAGTANYGVFIWGAQLEVGAYATSYIPSSVTFSGRTSDGTYFDSSGELITAGSGVSRTTYNPSNLSADPFLLLEESRTNSIRNNTMAGAVAGVPGTAPTNWNATATTELTRTIVGTGTENGITYIDLRYTGTVTAARTQYVFFEATDQISAGNSQTWTGSTYIKLVSGSLTNISSVFLQADTRNVALSYVNTPFSLNITSSITSTLSRLSATGTTAASNVAWIHPFLVFVTATSGAIDITLRIGLPQLEQGAGATSVIATSSAAVTRSADTSTSAAATRSADTSTSATATRGTDVAYIDVTLQPWFKPTEGTLYAECIVDNSTLSSGYRYPGLASLDNNTVLFCIHLFLTINSSLSLKQFGAEIFNSTNQMGQQSGTVTDGAICKLAVAYKENNSNWAFQGALGILDTSVTLPNNISRLRVGANRGTTPLSGWIRRIAYYPTRLTDAQLQTLTT